MPSGPTRDENTADWNVSSGNWDLRCTYRTWLSQQPCLPLKLMPQGSLEQRYLTITAMGGSLMLCTYWVLTFLEEGSKLVHIAEVCFRGSRVGMHQSSVWVWDLPLTCTFTPLRLTFLLCENLYVYHPGLRCFRTTSVGFLAHPLRSTPTC